jgi:hypothetical protein
MRTLGEFYKEKVLGRSDLADREFPDYRGEGTVSRDLFGWKLYSDKGKNFIECRSEEEARFLKIFFDSGMDIVAVPGDNNYLKTIVPELERLKKSIDEIISLYVDGVLNRKLKTRVKRQVYQELIAY